MVNGLYNGLDNGLQKGEFNGQRNGLLNGMFENETYKKDITKSDLKIYFSPEKQNSYVYNKSIIYDLSLNCFRGTIVGAVTQNPQSKGLIFNGSNTSIITNLPYNANGNILDYISTTRVTIGVWVKYTASQVSLCVNKRTGDGATYSYSGIGIGIMGTALLGSAGTKIGTYSGINTGNTADQRAIISTKSYNDNKWHYVVLVCGKSFDTLYIDGEFIGNSNITANWGVGGASPLYLGSLSNYPNPSALYYSGELGDFHYYLTELTQGEIYKNYITTKPYHT